MRILPWKTGSVQVKNCKHDNSDFPGTSFIKISIQIDLLSSISWLVGLVISWISVVMQFTSSEPSEQSSWLLHLADLLTHWPLSQVNWVDGLQLAVETRISNFSEIEKIHWICNCCFLTCWEKCWKSCRNTAVILPDVMNEPRDQQP